MPQPIVPAILVHRVCEEVLPKTKSTAYGIRWHPSRTESGGLLEIQGRKSSCEYLVVEFPSQWDGRCFHLRKTTGSPGSDADEAGYDVFIDRHMQNHCCCCKGFTYQPGLCKHISAMLAVIDNGWLSQDQANGEADVGETEKPF